MFIRRKEYLNSIESLQRQIDKLSNELGESKRYLYHAKFNEPFPVSYENSAFMVPEKYHISIKDLLSLLLKHLKMKIQEAPIPAMPDNKYELIRLVIKRVSQLINENEKTGIIGSGEKLISIALKEIRKGKLKPL